MKTTASCVAGTSQIHGIALMVGVARMVQVRGLRVLVWFFPAHVLSIIARFRGMGLTYIWLHGLWHVGGAYAIYQMLVPPPIGKSSDSWDGSL